MAHVIAVYEIDRRYCGPEEGGWWEDCGQLVRTLAVTHSAERADRICHRLNAWLARLQHAKRPVSSIAYTGGRHQIMSWERNAPSQFPSERAQYE